MADRDDGREDGQDNAHETAQDDPFAHEGAPEGEPARLDLEEDEPLPWLESVDDEDDYDRTDSGRLVVFLIAGLVVLGALVGGIWWATHWGASDELQADGSIIEAPEAPYKEAPKDAGGKTFAGTGDSAFAVSEGQTRPPRLEQGGEVVKPAVSPEEADAAAAPAPSGVGVQVGAYTSLPTAEAGWTRLTQQHGDILSGLKHRVVEGRADIGTVYRLQAMAPDVKAARDLCNRLKDAGAACQVKN